MSANVKFVSNRNAWFVFIRHRGERAAKKCLDEQHAHDTQKAVMTAITAGQFDISALKASRAPEKKESEVVPTLKSFFEETMNPLWEASLVRSTSQRYELCFRIHILPELGDLLITKLSRDRVKKFVALLMKKPAMKRTHSEKAQAEEPERKLSKDSIRNIVAALRGALSEAVEQGIIPANPASRLGRFYREAKQVREEVDPFTAEEIPLLLDSTLRHFGHDAYVLTLAAFHTGLRAGELAGLHWSDVDFRGRFLTVRRQFKDGSHRKTKTKKTRKVDVSDALLQELETLKKRRQAEYLSRGKNQIPDWVFMSPGQIVWEDGKPVGHMEGSPVDMNGFRNRVFWRACDKAEIRRRRFHDARHTFASILLMQGESPAYVRDQLGHSSIKMTVDVYGHFIPGANRQAVNKLPSLRVASNGKQSPEATGIAIGNAVKR
jgi:integrase